MAGILPVTPLEDPSNYDKITLAGIDSGGISTPPCVVSVTDASRDFSWDVKKSAGSQGQTITYRGWDLSKPKIKFKCWTSDQIKAVQDTIVPLFFYDAEKSNPKPVDVYYPKMFGNIILWLVATRVSDWTDEGSQLWVMTIDCLEYRQAKAKNATSTPQNSNNNQNGKQTKPTVQDALDEAIAAETRMFERPL